MLPFLIRSLKNNILKWWTCKRQLNILLLKNILLWEGCLKDILELHSEMTTDEWLCFALFFFLARKTIYKLLWSLNAFSSHLKKWQAFYIIYQMQIKYKGKTDILTKSLILQICFSQWFATSYIRNVSFKVSGLFQWKV